MVYRHMESRQLGFVSEPSVNVLKLNLTLVVSNETLNTAYNTPLKPTFGNSCHLYYSN